MKIIIGEGSCGIAAGAAKIYDYFAKHTKFAELSITGMHRDVLFGANCGRNRGRKETYILQSGNGYFTGIFKSSGAERI